MLPLGTDSPLRTTPYMNWAIIAVNIIAFLVQLRLGPLRTEQFVLTSVHPNLLSFVTYAFMHAGWEHLLGNMLFLYIFGNNVNDKMGHIGYLGFYLASAVMAGVGFVLLTGGGGVMGGALGGPGSAVIGASGAISAVTGAYLVLLPRSNISILFFFFIIARFYIPSVYVIALFFLKDIIGFSGQGTDVAYACHISGTIFGFVLTFLMLAARLLPRDPFDLMGIASRWNRRRQYRDIVSKGFNPYEYRPPENKPAGTTAIDPRVQEVARLRDAISQAIGLHDLPLAVRHYLELKQIDPTQVLARQAQLDVANQLASQQLFAEAADAYERFMTTYPKFEQMEQVELMLGLIYARYLSRFDSAKQHLVRAIARLTGERELAMARQELARIEPLANAARQ